MSSLTTIANVRDLVATQKTDAQVQSVIDREEAWLARELGIPIAAYTAPPFTQVVWRDPWGRSYNDIFLLRPTDDITVVDNDVTLTSSQLRLLGNGTIVERADAAWDGPLIEVTYSPNDPIEVVRGVIELCRLTIVETGFTDEVIGTYQYHRSARLPATAMQMQQASRRAIVRTLLPRPFPGTVQLTTGRLIREGVVVQPPT